MATCNGDGKAVDISQEQTCALLAYISRRVRCSLSTELRGIDRAAADCNQNEEQMYTT